MNELPPGRVLQGVGALLIVIAMFLFGVVGWYSDEMWKPAVYGVILVTGLAVSAQGGKVYRESLERSVAGGTSARAAPSWAEDPFGRHELRWFDGRRWTDQVSDAGQVGSDPPKWSAVEQVPEPLPQSQQAPVDRAVSPVDDGGETVQRPAAGLMASRAFTLVFDDGRRIGIDRRGVVGRDPDPRSGPTVEHVIPLDDPDRTISKGHLEFDVDRDGDVLWLTDIGSTNGSAISRSVGGSESLVAFVRTRAERGDTVQLGDRWFRIE